MLSVAAFLAAHWRSACLCLLDSSLRALGGRGRRVQGQFVRRAPARERKWVRGAGARTKARDQSARWTTYTGALTLAAVRLVKSTHKVSGTGSSNFRPARHGVVAVDDVPYIFADVCHDLGQVACVRQHPVLRREHRVVVLQRGNF